MERPLRSMLWVTVLFSSATLFSQNYLENYYNSWTTGSGSTTGFNQNGATAENQRVMGTDPFGASSVLWRASPDSQSNADGGWNSSYVNAGSGSIYQFSVWIKKTNSNSGTTYFGCRSSQHIYDGSTNQNIKNLNGSTNTNPYFWYGDLPQLNKWYLLVGYVLSGYSHVNNAAGPLVGGVFDGETGTKVLNTTNFQARYGTQDLSHRAYLYYDTNTSDRQYFFEPRIDKVDGTEPSIQQLLGGGSVNKLVFVYDSSGNQKARNPSNPSSTPSLKVRVPEEDLVQSSSESLPTEEEPSAFEESITIFPNPTKGNLTMVWDSQYSFLIDQISVTDMGNRSIPIAQNQSARQAQVDLSRYPTGVYLVRFLLKDGRSIQKKIIKK